MLSSPHKWHIPSYLVDISSSGKIDSITIHQNKAISFREMDRNIDNQCLFTSVLNKCCQHDDWYGDRDTGTWGHGAKSLRIWLYVVHFTYTTLAQQGQHEYEYFSIQSVTELFPSRCPSKLTFHSTTRKCLSFITHGHIHKYFYEKPVYVAHVVYCEYTWGLLFLMYHLIYLNVKSIPIARHSQSVACVHHSTYI